MKVIFLILFVAAVAVLPLYWLEPDGETDVFRPRLANGAAFTILYLILVMADHQRSSVEAVLRYLVAAPYILVNHFWPDPGGAGVDVTPFIIGVVATLYYLCVLASLTVFLGEKARQRNWGN